MVPPCPPSECAHMWMKNGYVSPSSSPPTPPSPLPVSVGPGQHKYFFSSSPSPSPPFSPPPSSHTSDENLPLLQEKFTIQQRALSAFSMDLPRPVVPDSNTSCLQHLLVWVGFRICSCCSWSLQKPHLE